MIQPHDPDKQVKRQWKRRWADAFLDVLGRTGNVTAASKAVSLYPSTAYHYRNQDQKFADAWDEALEKSVDILEMEARKRAFEGSDVLLIFLLKGARPYKYRDTHHIDMTVSKKPNEVAQAIRDAEAAMVSTIPGGDDDG